MSKSSLKPLGQWKCDSCGEIIQSPEDWILLIKEDDYFPDYRIVHKNSCEATLEKSEGHFSSIQISNFFPINFTTKDSVVNSLSKTSNGEEIKFDIYDLNSRAETIRRLTINYYEEARIRTEQGEIDIFGEHSKVLLEWSEKLKWIINLANERSAWESLYLTV